VDDVVSKSKTSRRLFRNLTAGLSGFIVALAVLLLTLRVQDYVPAGFVKLLLFVFPIPVACGLAVGLVSPRRAIAWAPLWSGIFAILVIALLSGALHETVSAASPARIAWMLAGALLAAMAGLFGQWAAQHSYVGKSILALSLACCLLGGVGCLLFGNQKQIYERDAVPQVLLEVDRNYIALPRGMDWDCRRELASESYVLTSRLDGKLIRVFAAPDAPAVRHIEYEQTGRGVDLSVKKTALEYLKKLGVRDAVTVGLGKMPEYWQGALGGTRLTVWRNGRMRLDALPTAIAGVARETGQ